MLLAQQKKTGNIYKSLFRAPQSTAPSERKLVSEDIHSKSVEHKKKVHDTNRVTEEEKQKLSSFVHSEEMFNLIAHQRHLKEDYRHFIIK